VVVAWNDGADDEGCCRLLVRVSKDGGVSFGQAVSLATENWFGVPEVAVGNGVIYVLYGEDGLRLQLRRSLDSGETWTSALTVADDGDGFAPSLTARGSSAYVAYEAGTAVRVRRTADKGATWSSPVGLSPSTGGGLFPHISLKGGVARATFLRCTELDSEGNCTGARIVYRQSSGGTSWTAPEIISRGARPLGIGWAGRSLVFYKQGALYLRARTQ
jgi:hypothetical protein